MREVLDSSSRLLLRMTEEGVVGRGIGRFTNRPYRVGCGCAVWEVGLMRDKILRWAQNDRGGCSG